MSKDLIITDQGIRFINSEDSELTLSNITIARNYMTMPVGNTQQRPSTVQVGMLRFNTTTANLEGYNGTNWVNIGL